MEPVGEESLLNTDNKEEQAYLDLLLDVLTTGSYLDDRTGCGILEKIGGSLRFNLQHGKIPLLTTKKMFFRGIVEELLWMISGSTSAKTLSDKKVHIWDANGSRETLDKLGFSNRKEGDLGPVYGFQWRHFGAKYVDSQTDYKGLGIDQLANAITMIETKPNSRQNVVSAWNPQDISSMILPPCHFSFQFFVRNGKLSCVLYQRSCDLVLGIPFNIVSYSLLTHMIAHITNLKPGELIVQMGSMHIYKNHWVFARKQSSRTPLPFPTIDFNPFAPLFDIDNFRFEHFGLYDYHTHPDSKDDPKLEMAI